MYVTEQMVQDCIEYPVPSRGHEWIGDQQKQYDKLHRQARTLYDNLRTQFDVSHQDAFSTAFHAFGYSKYYREYGDF